ncbi:outer membrane beta-barrel protein [Thiorhodococcus fuscus]|uniref:Outer membrane beta-barrel protein n=1 Tax=Thiorhodococcus fuscus TaxID=527200 RepID=A0ABW4YBA3_9GAMM
MNKWIYVCAAMTPVLTAGQTAGAQGLGAESAERASVDYSRSVAERPIETYRNSMVQLGAWQFYPGIELDELYDSNIYATPNDEKDDFITILKPRARLESDWSVHEIKFEAGGDFGFYGDYTDENYQDYYIRNSDRFEIVRDTNLIVGALYQHAHESRSSSDNIYSSAEPITYDLLSGTLGFERSLGIISLRIDGRIDDISYDNTDIIGGGTMDNSIRDREILDGGIRLGYKPMEGSEAYFKARMNEVTYDDSTKYGGPDRDNSGFELSVGLSKTISDLWVFDAYLGYAPSDYVDASLEDVSGGDAIIAGASVLWNPTALTSVIGTLDRRAYQTTQSGASAEIDTSISFEVQHKLTRSVILDTSLGYSNQDYAGSSREDDVYRLGLGASYFFTNLISVRAAYGYQERDSSIESNEFDKHMASLQLRVNY